MEIIDQRMGHYEHSFLSTYIRDCSYIYLRRGKDGGITFFQTIIDRERRAGGQWRWLDKGVGEPKR